MLFIIFLVISCDRKFYHGSIAVERHLWQLERIDTFYARGKYRPSAIWYNKHDKLTYIDNDHEFPYPFMVGSYLNNFDRK